VVILKPNFSMTKQRYNDRLIGTLIGCIISVGILRWIHAAGAAGRALSGAGGQRGVLHDQVPLHRDCRLRAGADPDQPADSGQPDGGGRAAGRYGDRRHHRVVFSFVLPSWEYRAIPKLVENVLQANRRYIAATRDLLLRKAQDDFAYRVQRKQFMDSLSALISSFQRMLDEPRSRHRAVDNLSRFIVQNYLVAAHVAAARIQVRQHYGELDVPAAEAAIEQATEAAVRSLTLASERLAGEERHGARGAGSSAHRQRRRWPA
jgi:uncharacterized membrane protein YccC